MGRLQNTRVLFFRILFRGALISGALLNVAYSQGFFSSLTQAVRAGFDPMEVRGHFDVGAQRYYCLTDTKTKVNQPNAVQGYIATSPDGSTHFKQTAVSMLSCDAVEKRGQLIYDSQPTQDAPQSSTTSISAPSSDPGTWNVLGVKIGEGADDAFHSILAQYPKAAKVDGRMVPKMGQFDVGEEIITGATIVDGWDGVSDYVDGRQVFFQGKDNLGTDTERDILGYVWPSRGPVVLISRTHVYGRQSGVIAGVPTIAAIRNALIAKYGLPNIEKVIKAGSSDVESTQPRQMTASMSQFDIDDVNYYGAVGDTWVWTAHAQVNLNSPPLLRACEQRMRAVIAIAMLGPRPAGWSSPPIQLGNGQSQCGTLMIVSVVAMQGSDDFPSKLTEVLFDDDAFERASVALRENVQQREKAALEKAKKAGTSASPVL